MTICESNGYGFVLVVDPVNTYTWSEANQWCADNLGTTLASIHSGVDIWNIEDLEDWCGGMADAWIGGYAIDNANCLSEADDEDRSSSFWAWKDNSGTCIYI